MTSNGNPSRFPHLESTRPDGRASSGCLRETRAYLMPEAVRDGLEMALAEVYDLSLDVGTDTLREHPVAALARAILADLEAALDAVDELEHFATGGTTPSRDMAPIAPSRAIADLLAPQLEALRQLQSDLQPHLTTLRETLGEEPAD